MEVHQLPFGRLEDLWIEAAHRLEEGDFRSALAFTREALLVLETWTQDYRRGMCATGLEAAHRFLARYGEGGAHGLEDRLRDAARAYENGEMDRCASVLEGLQEGLTDLHLAQAGRVRETLAEKEDLLGRLEGMDLDLRDARELLAAAEEACGLDEHARALDLLHRLDEAVYEAKRVRMGELKERLRAVEDRLIEAEALGAPVDECAKLLDQAQDAYRREDLVLGRELTQRAERTVLEAQKRQIEKALQLRRRYIARVKELVDYLKPILREAEAYGLEVEAPRGLLREVVDLLREEDFFASLERGEAAKGALLALLPRVVEEREKRGVEKPTEGGCRRCSGTDLVFEDDGWGECRACGLRFVWTARDLPRIITFLRKKLVPQSTTPD